MISFSKLEIVVPVHVRNNLISVIACVQTRIIIIIFFLSKIVAQQSYTDNSSGNKVYVMLCVMLFLPIIRVCSQATYVKLISVSFLSFRFVSIYSFFSFCFVPLDSVFAVKQITVSLQINGSAA